MASQSRKEDHRPATLWFWDDWFSAFDVQICSFAAQGLWVNMLGIMAKSEIKGALVVAGRQIDGKILAKRFGKSEEEIEILLRELEDNGVFSRLPDGTIINRRMFSESQRQDQISKMRSEAGKAGAEARWQSDGKENGKDITPIEYEDELKNKNKGIESKDALFEKWFARYPRHEDKGKAKEKWLLLVDHGTSPQTLEDALTGYINCLNSNETERQFIKYAKTFLYVGNPKKKIPGTWEQYLPYADPKYKKKPRL